MPRTPRNLAKCIACLTLLACDAKTESPEPATAGTQAPAPATAGQNAMASAGKGNAPTAGNPSSGKPGSAGNSATAGAGGAPSEEANISRSTVAADKNPAVPDTDYTTFIAHLNKFGLDLGQAQATANQLTTKNIIYSPLSVSMALGMTYAGARGTTAAEMKTVLGDSFGAGSFHVAANRLARELAARATSRKDADGKEHRVELNLADAVFVERTLSLETEYLDVLGREYDSGVRQVDFINAHEPARMGINRWVEQQTHDRIKDLLPMMSIDESTRLVLVNALYFYGSWATPFAHAATRDAPFHLLDASTANVPTMHGQFSLRYATAGDYAVADFPYEGGALRMTIVLPASAEKFQAVRGQVSAAWLESITKDLAPTLLSVALPKFKMTVGSFSLSDGLKSLGMKEAFTDQGNFSGMIKDARLQIADVVQKAFIAVDEDGTEAAAATAVIVSTTSAPVEQPKPFVVDRPFLFFIRDKNGIVLFSGQVVKPEQ